MIKFSRSMQKIRYFFFWNKVDPQKNNDNKQTQEKWQGKDQYLAELKKKREEYEKIKIKEQKDAQSSTIRQSREHEVNYGKIDYAKVLIDNLNINHTEEFKHPEELFNFLGSLKVTLTEENLMICVNALIQFSDIISEEDLIRFEFQEFQAILTKQIRMISKSENLVKITQLLDILCLPSEHDIWKQLEITILNRMSKLKLNELQSILTHLSNQREGSDQFWDQCENQLQGDILQLQSKEDQFENLITTLVSYWKVQRGTKGFLKFLISQLLNNYDQLKINDSKLQLNTLIQSVLVFGQLAEKQEVEDIVKSDYFKEYFLELENYFLKQQDQLNFEQICLICQGFGFQFGSEKLFQNFENKIIENIDQYNIQQLKMIIQSFILTYRGSKKLYQIIMKKISILKHELTAVELAQIVKAVYISENDNQEFYSDLEKRIIQRLKEVREITIDEIYDIAYSYLITRVGSREFYKLLEIVITFRFDELKDNAILMSKLHDLYLKSALCDAKLIERMAAVL